MSIDDELDPELVPCLLCLGFGTINVDDITSTIVCLECGGERWVAP